MLELMNFYVDMFASLVQMLFSWELFSGFSLGDFLVAVAVIVILVCALRLRVRD